MDEFTQPSAVEVDEGRADLRCEHESNLIIQLVRGVLVTSDHETEMVQGQLESEFRADVLKLFFFLLNLDQIQDRFLFSQHFIQIVTLEYKLKMVISQN